MSRERNVDEQGREQVARASDSQRVRDLFREHGAFVCRSLRRQGVSEADLDDLLQEVFLVVHQRLSDYEERGRARAWLYSICVRVAKAQHRRVGRRREAAGADVPDESFDATQLETMEDRQALELGHALLARLAPAQREVFVLYEVEDMSMAEIAEILDCPLQTAYSRLHRARQRILEEVERARAEESQP